MSKLRILFVDDEVSVLDGLRRMLRKQRNEWEMSFVENPVDALSLMEKKPFDVLVTDMRMPGMTGADLLKEVADKHPNIIRFILSGHTSDPKSTLKSVKLAHRYLSKPCDARTLRSEIDSVYALRNILENNNLKQLVTKLDSLPSLPSLYMKIMNELKKPDGKINITSVGEIISDDMAMSAKILHVANSPFFGLRRQVSVPSDAVMFLGLDTVKSLVLSCQVFSQFDQKKLKGISLDLLWNHSMCTGGFAKKIATMEKCEKDDIDNSFMAGLLHDLGKLVLVSNLPDKYNSVLSLVEKNKFELNRAEQEVFGTTHSEVGAYLVGLWGLSSHIIEIIAFHHYPEKGNNKQFSPLTAVYAANIIENVIAGTNGKKSGEISDKYLSGSGLSENLGLWQKACMDMLEVREAALK